ncbi:hypothetical protein B0H63DRAFT_564703 [Podospora didyma]|uniref:Uncharacterized protein n=1 Tax=Podospora didyma TaxID=330526 RepID=A0AAE0K674_9PEZI|nr:hypothetical protein B0H63DRAFT_564703 [Podospora didyma]
MPSPKTRPFPESLSIRHRNTHRTTVLAFGAPPSIADDLVRLLLNNSNGVETRHPFWMYLPLVDEVIRLKHPAVWTICDLVLATEESRPPAEFPAPDYRRLHGLARHAIHVSRTLELVANIVNANLAHQGRFISLLASGADLQAAGARDQLNEIGLAFNTVAQYDARISLDISRATHADGAAMRSSHLLLGLLPPPSCLWLVSPGFWRYWPSPFPSPFAPHYCGSCG